MKPQPTNPRHELTGPWQVKIDSRGRFTLPKPICAEFGLRTGDTVVVALLDDGEISLRFFRRLKRGCWLNLLQRREVDRLPDEHDERSTTGAVQTEGSSTATLPQSANPESTVNRPVAPSALERIEFINLPGKILRDDFVGPLGLSAKSIAQAIFAAPKAAAAFEQRLDKFMTHVDSAMDLEDCLRLDRFFGLSDGYFWGLITECDVQNEVANPANRLAQIKPFAPADLSAAPDSDRIVAPPHRTLEQADPESAVRQAIGNSKLAQDKLDWVPGEILREDFVLPLGLSSKTIAQAVVRGRRKAAEFARRLDDFMAHVEGGLDLDECLRLDRYFGLRDGFFWRVFCSCEVRTAVAEHATALDWIKPRPRPDLPAAPDLNPPVPPHEISPEHARSLLPSLIGRLSLDLHDRGWISFLPFTLWEAVIGIPSEPFRDDDVALFRHLATVAGGWARFDERAGPCFVDELTWVREFTRWKDERSATTVAQQQDPDRARRLMRWLSDAARNPPPATPPPPPEPAPGVALRATIPNKKKAWFDKLLARYDGSKPTAPRSGDRGPWDFWFTTPDATSTRTIARKLRQAGIRDFETLVSS